MMVENPLDLYYNGNIYVKFNPLTKAESIVISGDRILHFGKSKDTVAAFGKKAGKTVDLQGRTVMPGFIDAHIHLDDLGNSLNFLDLRNVPSISEMKERIAKYRETKKDRKVIIGMGWDQEGFTEKRWPTRWDLDEIEPSIPVYLERFCEHAGVSNSAMLEFLDSEKFSRSVLPITDKGQLTGVVKEEANDFIRAKALAMESDLDENLVKGTEYLASLGITTIGFVHCGQRSFDALVSNRERIKIRVRAYLSEEISDRILTLRMKSGEDQFLKINGIKLFVDGALGAETAYMREPYEDDPSNRGNLHLDSARLKQIVSKYSGKDIQFAIHAIGDAAIDTIIAAFDTMKEDESYHPRIEHCTVLRPGQAEKLKRLGIGVTVQPEFVIDDWWAVNRLGIERSRMAYPLGTLVNNGIRIGLSTDSPVEPPNPWLTVDAAVNRGEKENREILKYSSNERVDINSALDLYTSGSAELILGSELGSLEVGKFADFIVLDRAPFNSLDLRSIKVIETYVGGNLVFKYS